MAEGKSFIVECTVEIPKGLKFIPLPVKKFDARGKREQDGCFYLTGTFRN